MGDEADVVEVAGRPFAEGERGRSTPFFFGHGVHEAYPMKFVDVTALAGGHEPDRDALRFRVAVAVVPVPPARELEPVARH
jgi:hypothetical protein